MNNKAISSSLTFVVTQIGLSWSSYVLWTSTPEVLAAVNLSAHEDCRLTMEYVFSLFLTTGSAAVATNVSQCGIPWGGLAYTPKLGSVEYIEPWYRGTGNERFVDFCENSLVCTGMVGTSVHYWCTQCWKLPRTRIQCWNVSRGASGLTRVQVMSHFS